MTVSPLLSASWLAPKGTVHTGVVLFFATFTALRMPWVHCGPLVCGRRSVLETWISKTANRNGTVRIKVVSKIEKS